MNLVDSYIYELYKKQQVKIINTKVELIVTAHAVTQGNLPTF